MTWKSMDTAPKTGGDDGDYCGRWILAKDSSGEARVIRWTTEYPYNEGTWMYAYEPTDYIDGITRFYPVKWMEIPD